MGHLSANDVVPALRHNLAFEAPPWGLGGEVLSVKSLETGEETKLRGFEFSLARMLDGRRTAQQVVSAASDIGLPVSLEDLEAFVKKLDQRRLVGGGAEAIATSPFEPREQWEPRTRELFRQALRTGRRGNVEDAVTTLDVLLHERPNVTEAQQLRHRLWEQMRSAETQLPFRTVFTQTEQAWRAEQQPPAVVARPPRPAPGEDRWMVAVAASFAVALLALTAAIIPFPREVNATAVLVPITTTKLAAPREGKVAAVAVKLGQWIEQDAVLFSYDVTADLGQLEEAVTELQALEQLLVKSPPSTEAKQAAAAYQRAEVALTAAQAEVERAGGDAAQASLDRALETVTAAQQAMLALLPPEQQAQLELRREQVRTLQRRLQEEEVKAPTTGEITRLEVQPGQALAAGAEVARIDDTRRLRAVATVESNDLRALAPGLPVLVLSQGRATSTTVSSVRGRQVEVVVDNTARSFEPSLGQLKIRGKAVPLLAPRDFGVGYQRTKSGTELREGWPGMP